VQATVAQKRTPIKVKREQDKRTIERKTTIRGFHGEARQAQWKKAPSISILQ